MNAVDYFGTIAEVAITLEGFSGLVVAFKSGTSLSKEDLRRIIYILVLSFSVLVTALLPAGLSGINISPEAAIRYSCILLATITLVLGLNGILSWRSAQISPHFPRATAISLVSAILIALVLFLGATNIVVDANAGLLLIAQLSVLLIAGWIFLSTIIWTRAQSEKSNDA